MIRSSTGGVVEQRTSRTSSIAESFVIDEDAIRRAVAAFVVFAVGFYELRRRDPGTVHLGLSLSGVAHKHFGRLPSHPTNSFTIGHPRIDDPLQVPVAPLKITKAQLAKPDAVASTMVEHIARVFRLQDAYYTP